MSIGDIIMGEFGLQLFVTDMFYAFWYSFMVLLGGAKYQVWVQADGTQIKFDINCCSKY